MLFGFLRGFPCRTESFSSSGFNLADTLFTFDMFEGDDCIKKDSVASDSVSQYSSDTIPGFVEVG